MIFRLLAWWIGRRMKAHERELAAEPRIRTPLEFPMQLGVHIDAIEEEIIRRRGRGHLYDAGGTNGYPRRRVYACPTPQNKVVDVHYAYREEDGTVWSVRVTHGGRDFTAQLGRVALEPRIEPITEALGKPVIEKREAPVIKSLLFLQPEAGYLVEIYSPRYEDITGYYEDGDVRSIEWFSRELAPEGYPDRP